MARPCEVLIRAWLFNTGHVSNDSRRNRLAPFVNDENTYRLIRLEKELDRHSPALGRREV
jgi:hypothetical protein